MTARYIWHWRSPKIPSILQKGEVLRLVTVHGKAIKGRNGNVLVERQDGTRVVTTIQGIRRNRT